MKPSTLFLGSPSTHWRDFSYIESNLKLSCKLNDIPVVSFCSKTVELVHPCLSDRCLLSRLLLLPPTRSPPRPSRARLECASPRLVSRATKAQRSRAPLPASREPSRNECLTSPRGGEGKEGSCPLNVQLQNSTGSVL